MNKSQLGLVAGLVLTLATAAPADDLLGGGRAASFDCPGGSRPPTASVAAVNDWLGRLFARPEFTNFTVVPKASIPAEIARGFNDSAVWSAPNTFGLVTLARGTALSGSDPEPALRGALQGTAQACSTDGGTWSTSTSRKVQYGNLARTITYAAAIANAECRGAKTTLHFYRVEAVQAEGGRSGHVFMAESDNEQAAENAIGLFGWAIASEALSCSS